MTVLGLDVGGTSTRAVLASAAGELLGSGRAAGANLRSSVGSPEANIADAVRQALAGSLSGPGGPGAGDHRPDRPTVDAIAVGAAGAGSARRDEVVALVTRGLRGAGVRVEPVVGPDLDVAFRAAGIGGDGVLLLAGTGAVAARYTGYACADRCDGMGWALGDEGSGTWLGWGVLRAAAADLDGRGPATELTASVLAALGIAPGPGATQALIRAVDDLRPAEFARFAPLALTTADAVARGLVREAVRLLTRTARRAGARAERPLVLAGGLLGAGPVRAGIEAGFPQVRHVAHPVVGACAWAAATLGVDLDTGRLASALAGVDGRPR